MFTLRRTNSIHTLFPRRLKTPGGGFARSCFVLFVMQQVSHVVCGCMWWFVKNRGCGVLLHVLFWLCAIKLVPAFSDHIERPWLRWSVSNAFLPRLQQRNGPPNLWGPSIMKRYLVSDALTGSLEEEPLLCRLASFLIVSSGHTVSFSVRASKES